MKSELGLRFLRFLENEKNLGDMRMDLAGIGKVAKKKSNFSHATIHFLKSPEIDFYHFLTIPSHKINCRKILLKKAENCNLSQDLNSRSLHLVQSQSMGRQFLLIFGKMFLQKVWWARRR